MNSVLKIKAVLLFVLQQLGGMADFIKIFKIIYFANREHLATYGRPIIDDDFIAMQNGPVPSWLYDAVKLENKNIGVYKPVSDSIEHVFFYIIKAKEEPDMTEMSKSDVKCLLKSIQENKDLSADKLSEKSHDSAYEKRRGRVMNILDIAHAGGATPEVMGYIAEDQAINQMLECYR